MHHSFITFLEASTEISFTFRLKGLSSERRVFERTKSLAWTSLHILSVVSIDFKGASLSRRVSQRVIFPSTTGRRKSKLSSKNSTSKESAISFAFLFASGVTRYPLISLQRDLLTSNDPLEHFSTLTSCPIDSVESRLA